MSSSSWNRSLSSRDTALRAPLAAAEATVKVKIASSTQQRKMCCNLDILDSVGSSVSSSEDRSSLSAVDEVESSEDIEAKACFSGSWIFAALVEAIANQKCGEKAAEWKMLDARCLSGQENDSGAAGIEMQIGGKRA